ncbi:hypothetical protein PR202_ga31094 [Eleusine coracana subsp. coracana]|uniref:Uncharacterized protein n=1 Tax=Eleusine coracana subsp. coracana TaxID=191504 RepID=A0AAV5DQG1_ELECO|nr:hypothetical protein PR202_ga31094 [Eleusine coracana subsp. coracana]
MAGPSSIPEPRVKDGSVVLLKTARYLNKDVVAYATILSSILQSEVNGVKNQLPDGSWGDEAFFMFRDRIISTLACVVALTSWNIHKEKCERGFTPAILYKNEVIAINIVGLLFIRENMWRLSEESEDWMLVGFEIAFPSLLDMAKNLGLDIPYHEPALKEIYTQRKRKLAKYVVTKYPVIFCHHLTQVLSFRFNSQSTNQLKLSYFRIPRDILHAMPTTLLHSLEGMVDLDWEKLLKLRCLDGSFHCSPAATATAFKETGDTKCFEYLEGITKKFNGGGKQLTQCVKHGFRNN